MNIRRRPTNLRDRAQELGRVRSDAKRSARVVHIKEELHKTKEELLQETTARVAAESVAMIDGLTNLENTIGGDISFRRICREVQRNNRRIPYAHQTTSERKDIKKIKPQGVGIISIDLDKFKVLNDTFGHAAGDSALKCVAGILKEEVRPGDAVIRNGGEELLIFLDDKITSIKQVLDVAERIRSRIERDGYVHEGTQGKVTASMGVSFFVPSDDLEIKELNLELLSKHLKAGEKYAPSYKDYLNEVDELLYWTKENGRNGICYSEGRRAVKFGHEKTVLKAPNEAKLFEAASPSRHALIKSAAAPRRAPSV